MELVYKLVWLSCVVLPLVLQGEFPASAAAQVVLFVTFIVGDVVAIPFRHVFARDAGVPEPGKVGAV